jgi:hypothetical protein
MALLGTWLYLKAHFQCRGYLKRQLMQSIDGGHELLAPVVCLWIFHISLEV